MSIENPFTPRRLSSQQEPHRAGYLIEIQAASTHVNKLKNCDSG